MDKERVMDEDSEDGPEDTEIIYAFRVGGRVIGHEEPEEDEDDVLKAEGEPVDGAPGRVVCDNTGKQAGEEHAEEEARGDD